MAISFPSSPALNQQYTYSNRTWQWTGAVWQSVGTPTAQGIQGIQGSANLYSIGTTPPTYPAIGSGWINTNDGRTYVWDGTEWFESYDNLMGIQGTQGIQGLGYAQLQGVQGTQGLQGLQGLSIQGIQGPQGTQGVQGFGYAQLQGTQGLQGGGFNQAQGIQGVQGVQGLQGVQGPLGNFNALITNTGDLIVGNGFQSTTRLPVGTKFQTLVVDSTQSPGIRWADDVLILKIMDAI